MNDPSPFNSDETSGANQTIWTLTAPSPEFERLDRALETEVLVIGGGIAGVTTAYCLAQSGRRVVLVEDGFLGSGETSRTTAHLTYVLDQRYADLLEHAGKETTQRIAESHRTAIAWIQSTVERENISCHFKTIDGYLFAHPTATEDSLLTEFAAAREIGLPVSLEENTPGLSDGTGKTCIRFRGQGQLHSLLYLHGLAEAVIRMGGRIFTQSKAANITSEGAEVNGFVVTARHTVITTNMAIHTLLKMHLNAWPYRSYAMAFRLPKGSLQPALWWDTGNRESEWLVQPYHFVRLETDVAGNDFLIAGGEDHRTGQTEKEAVSYEERYERIREWAVAHFPGLGEIVAHWSGQISYSLDGLAFAGKDPGNENTWLITADSGNGMTYAAIGGMLITDLINGRKNDWESLYDPARSIARQVPGDYLHELGNMAAQYKDWVTPGDPVTAAQLKPGEGAVIREGLKKIAVYRDQNNRLHQCSAVCPHMGGILKWNADEQTFDCPLHGSRFTVDGKVINGPANEDLEKIG
jgi:glycine/D-amino acid oxidase-like deaminating enzyme/nitrite reductase/ring-hydroxylating ferredoxin subunit